MTNYAAQSDPGRNRNFSRTWGDDPLALPDLRHLDREIGQQAVQDVGRRAIGRWLDKAAGAQNGEAAAAFAQADGIRRRMGLDWSDLIDGRRAA